MRAICISDRRWSRRKVTESELQWVKSRVKNGGNGRVKNRGNRRVKNNGKIAKSKINRKIKIKGGGQECPPYIV